MAEEHTDQAKKDAATAQEQARRDQAATNAAPTHASTSATNATPGHASTNATSATQTGQGEQNKATQSEQAKRDTAAADKAVKEATTAAEKAAADKTAADKAVADANNKVAAATAAVNEEQAKKDQLAAADQRANEPVVVIGRAGMAFTIDGPGLGSGGTLTIGGRPIPTTRWDDRSIRGTLPPGVSGDVVLNANGVTRRGTFPTPVHEVTKTTTVTTEIGSRGNVLSPK